MAVPRVQKGRQGTAREVTGRTRSLGIPTSAGVRNAPSNGLHFQKSVSSTNK